MSEGTCITVDSLTMAFAMLAWMVSQCRHVTRHGGSCAVSAPARIVARANKRRPAPFGMDADGVPPIPSVVDDPELVADNR